MRFVGITSEQRSTAMLHRVRLILNRQRTQLSNAMGTHLAEFGIGAPISRSGIEQLLDGIADPSDECVRMIGTRTGRMASRPAAP
jgi:transposase